MKKAITSDLFEIEPCPNCDGSGQVPVYCNAHEERTEDCVFWMNVLIY